MRTRSLYHARAGCRSGNAALNRLRPKLSESVATTNPCYNRPCLLLQLPHRKAGCFCARKKQVRRTASFMEGRSAPAIVELAMTLMILGVALDRLSHHLLHRRCTSQGAASMISRPMLPAGVMIDSGWNCTPRRSAAFHARLPSPPRLLLAAVIRRLGRNRCVGPPVSWRAGRRQPRLWNSKWLFLILGVTRTAKPSVTSAIAVASPSAASMIGRPMQPAGVMIDSGWN